MNTQGSVTARNLWMKDEYGNEHLYVDEDMRLRLEAKLLYSIVTGFKVLPV